MVLQNHTPYVLILVNSDDEPVATLPPSGHEIRVSFVPPVYLQAVGIPVPVLAPPSDGETFVLVQPCSTRTATFAACAV
jgi:hypothetical protein